MYVHMCQGQTLAATFDDPLEAGVNVRMDMQIAVYVMFSRAKLLDKHVLMQTFSPWLFQQGALPGPTILIRKLLGYITSEQASCEFKRRLTSRRSVNMRGMGWIRCSRNIRVLSVI